MAETALRPVMAVVSAPSGAGKTTLVTRILAERPDMRYSVSCTTRAPRGTEQHGRDYWFLTEDEFERRAAAGEFLEWARVHGHLYGTLRRTVQDALDAGRSVLLDIDVQGARQIRDSIGREGRESPLAEAYVDVFIVPPSLQALRQRLVSRAQDAPETIERRIRNAELEMQHAGEYRYVIVNDDLDAALAQFRSLLERELQKKASQPKTKERCVP